MGQREGKFRPFKHRANLCTQFVCHPQIVTGEKGHEVTVGGAHSQIIGIGDTRHLLMNDSNPGIGAGDRKCTIRRLAIDENDLIGPVVLRLNAVQGLGDEVFAILDNHDNANEGRGH